MIVCSRVLEFSLGEQILILSLSLFGLRVRKLLVEEAKPVDVGCASVQRPSKVVPTTWQGRTFTDSPAIQGSRDRPGPERRCTTPGGTRATQEAHRGSLKITAHVVVD